MKINVEYKDKTEYEFKDLKFGHVFTYSYTDDTDDCETKIYLGMKCNNCQYTSDFCYIDLENFTIYDWNNNCHIIDIIPCELNEV